MLLMCLLGDWTQLIKESKLEDILIESLKTQKQREQILGRG